MNITRIARPGRLRLIIAAVIAAMAGLVIPLSQIASARTAEAAAAGDSPSRACSPAAWPTAYPPQRQMCSPPPSCRWQRSR